MKQGVLVINYQLRFKKLTNNIIKNTYSNLRLLICYQKYVLQEDQKTLLCESFVMSHLNFCDASVRLFSAANVLSAIKKVYTNLRLLYAANNMLCRKTKKIW